MSDDGIDRRNFLRGAAGSVLSLPLLEAGLSGVGDTSEADAADSGDAGPDEPLYYIVCFAGTATGASGNYGDQLDHVDCVPDATGENYPLPDPALQPLDRELDVHGQQGSVRAQEYVSLLSGLSMPAAKGPNQKPPGSRVAYDEKPKFHNYEVAPLVSGVSSDDAATKRDRFRSGTSSDQIVASEWNRNDVFNGRVQADLYGKFPGTKKFHTPLSTLERSDGSVAIHEPLIDPRRAFKRWIGSSDGEVEQTRRELLMGSSDRSVLDGVLEGFNELQRSDKLPKRDRQRLQRHADQVRSLEKKIDDLKDRMVCSGDFPEDQWSQRKNRGQVEGVSNGWLYEDLRADLMSDIMVRSMACGRTNIATLCYSLEGSRMSIRYLGEQSDQNGIHGSAHSTQTPALSTQWVVQWHVDQWVKLLQRLAREPAPTDSDESMLDRTAVVLLFESGVELNGSYRKNHTTNNMAALVGGRAGTDGKRLRGNVHVDAGNSEHPTSAQMTAMEAVGVQKNKFGEVPWSTHSELFESV